RGGDRLDRGYAAAVRGDSARYDLDLDDDQCYGFDPAGALCGGGAANRGRCDAAERDNSERYFEGVYRAGDVYLSGCACDAAGDGHLCMGGRRGAGVEYDLDLRLPHARG